MQVRAKQGTGKFLFEWDPIANRVEMIVKDMYYLIELKQQGINSSYTIIEERRKSDTSNKPYN